MNVVLECDVILSKKLESICESGEPISIQINSVSGNKGRAIIRITCKDGTSEQEISKIGETSVMFKVNSVAEDMKSISTTARVTNLVSGLPTSFEKAIARTSPNVPEGEEYVFPNQKKPIYTDDNQGVVQEPRYQQEQAATQIPQSPNVANDTLRIVLAALAAAGLPIPDGLANTQSTVIQNNSIPPVQPYIAPVRQQIVNNYIRTYDELANELINIPGIDQKFNIPTDRKLTPVEAESIMARTAKLRKKAYLRNNIKSQLSISDLFTTIDGGGSCLSLLPGAVADLTRIPARNLLNSQEIKGCFDNNMVSLVGEAEYIASCKKIEADCIKWDREGTLPVYGSREDVIVEAYSERDSIHVGPESENLPPPTVYGDDPLISNLVQNLPTNR
jgi:hypothetical protein